jgi:hypothetical protein
MTGQTELRKSCGFARRLVLPLLLAVAVNEPPIAHAAETTAARADDFLNSIGVCSAISVRGEKLSSTIDASRFLGLRWIRAGYESGIPVADLIELHKRTGVRFSYGLMSGGSDLGRLLDGARQLASADALIALEGNNEPNNWGVTYEGQRGGGRGTNSWLPVARLQRDLYRAVKGDTLLKDYPVWSPSEVGAQSDNVGLQFLTIPSGAGALMPDGTQFADFANCHNYMTHPAWSGLHDNQTWVAADPTSACRVDGLYGNHGVTWLRRFQGYPEAALPTLPRVTTETGITIGGPITEEIQGLLYLSVYLDQFKRGWKHTAIYLLRDRTDEAGNQTFGFYKPDYTPRLAATYLHNLTTVLADKPSATQPGRLQYSIPNQPPTVHDLLLQKSDGTFELVVWGERFTGGSDNISVNLGKTYRSAKIFNPVAGASPVQVLSQVSSIPLTLSNHPVVIELAGNSGGESAASGPAFKVPRLWEYSAPLISPEKRDTNPSRAQKDPTVVFFGGKWHVFMTVKLPGKSAIEYCSFSKWEEADASARTILNVSDSDYYCAPQVFYFRPHRKWYLVYQVGVPGRDKMWVAYSTTENIADPHSWTRALPMLDGGKDDPRKVGGLDYWIICDEQHAYLFLTSLDGRMWRLRTALGDFPGGFGDCELALQAKIFEASHTYRLKGMDKYLTIIEENGRRYYKAYLADRLDGQWLPIADTAERPFAGWNNVRPAAGVEPWTDNISHGELIRDGCDETLTVDPAELRFIFQGMWDKHKSGKGYGEFQWRIGMLKPVLE